MSDKFHHERRKLLRAIGLGALSAYAGPVLLGLDVARASGASSISGRSRPSYSRPSRSRPAPQRQSAPPAPPPEIALLAGQAIDVDLTAAGYTILQSRRLRHAMLYRLGLPQGSAPQAARDELARLFPQARLDDNALYRPDEFLCDDGACLAHRMIGWQPVPGLENARIGMIDTGVNGKHEALSGQALTILQGDLGTRSSAGRQHGTAIAALLIGRADSRTPGLLPNARLVAVEAFHSSAGSDAADAYALADALDRLIDAGVMVINLSFSGPENLVLHEMVQQAQQAGIAIVAAAGNGGPGAPPAFPAAWPEVIAVTAVDAAERPYRQANRGEYVTLAAPGVNLWTAASISGGRLRSGTSYAAPFVTAALAARIAREPGIPPSAHVERLVACARDLGEPGPDPVFGSGVISMQDQCNDGSASGNAAQFQLSGE